MVSPLKLVNQLHSSASLINSVCTKDIFYCKSASNWALFSKGLWQLVPHAEHFFVRHMHYIFMPES